MEFRIRKPANDLEMETIMQLRWKVLRAPWNQPMGSERDDMEAESIHAICLNEKGDVVAAGRLQENNDKVGQVRYMCVEPELQGNGLGKRILNFLENEARLLGLHEIILNARENAVPFYISSGYMINGDGPLLFGAIPHKVMSKKL